MIHQRNQQKKFLIQGAMIIFLLKSLFLLYDLLQTFFCLEK